MYLKKIEKREVLPSDLNRLNFTLNVKHIGTVRKIADSSVLSLHIDYCSMLDRFCEFYNLPKNKQFQAILFNIFVRAGAREYALEHRTKNLPAGYLCIPLNANKYTLKNQNPVFKRSLEKMGGTLSYRKMRTYFDYIKNCSAFITEKGKFTFGKDSEGNTVPSEDNEMTKVRYIGKDKDPFFNRKLPDSREERVDNFNDYVLMKIIGKLLLKKEKKGYEKYKEQFKGSSIIRYTNIHFSSGIKTKKKTEKPRLAFTESEAGVVEQINKANRSLIKNNTVFEEFQVTRIFKNDEGFGGRFYSNFHRWPSKERKKAAAYLGYQEYDITASMATQRKVWDLERVELNENIDVYKQVLKYTSLFTNKEKTDYDMNKIQYYRNLVKKTFVVALGSSMNIDTIKYHLVKDLIAMGAIYDPEDVDKLHEIKKELIMAGLNEKDIYKEPKYWEQRSICASNRHKRKRAYELENNLKSKHSLTLKASYKLIKAIPSSLYAVLNEKIDSTYMLQAQDAEGMATTVYYKYKTSKGNIALACHDSIYTNNESEFMYFKDLVKSNTLKLKKNEDIALNPIQERKTRRPRIKKVEYKKRKIQKEKSQKKEIRYNGYLYNNSKKIVSRTGPPGT